MMRFTLLGTGSSGGVPRLGGTNGAGDWGTCDPSNPKNRRRRCAMLVESHSDQGVTRVCIDAGPDFHAQMRSAKVPMLDALVLTHEHADHIHGIDDMRQFVNVKTAHQIQVHREAGTEITKDQYFAMVDKARIDCYAGLTCHSEMTRRFDYLFEQALGTIYPPIMHLKKIDKSFTISGKGGDISFIPFSVPHGAINAYGFKIGELVYLPDVFDLTDEAHALIKNCRVFIVDCLQFREHGTHANYDKAMRWIDELKPERAILTNLHNTLDYQELENMTPDHVTPAFDGMEVEL